MIYVETKIDRNVRTSISVHLDGGDINSGGMVVGKGGEHTPFATLDWSMRGTASQGEYNQGDIWKEVKVFLQRGDIIELQTRLATMLGELDAATALRESMLAQEGGIA